MVFTVLTEVHACDADYIEISHFDTEESLLNFLNKNADIIQGNGWDVHVFEGEELNIIPEKVKIVTKYKIKR